MQELTKKAGIILGHVICVLVLIYCFANTKELFPEESKTVDAPLFPTECSITPPAYTPLPTKQLSETQIPTLIPEQISTPGSMSNMQPTEITDSSITNEPTSVPVEEPTAIPAIVRDSVKQKVLDNIAEGKYQEISNSSDSWWFRRKENHEPSGTGELFDISEFDGVYLNEHLTEEDKVIYLTIDCGYGSNNTAVLLDIFKEQDVKVTFFVTNYFLKANPEEVRRMVKDGHTIGNHSVSHPDLTTMTEEEIYAEIIGCEEEFFNITGEQMDLFFRPPTGAYSKRTMQITEDLGYLSVFWSIAYNDYDKQNQPGKEYVISHFKQYHHNGAIALMHNDSDSNLEAMKEVILFLKEEGYRFGSLEEFR